MHRSWLSVEGKCVRLLTHKRSPSCVCQISDCFDSIHMEKRKTAGGKFLIAKPYWPGLWSLVTLANPPSRGFGRGLEIGLCVAEIRKQSCMENDL